MTLPFMAAQRTVSSSASSALVQVPYVPGMERTWVDGKPPHGFAPDGSWVSLVAGVNADGSVVGGRDPTTGRYAPGDAYIGNRPVYYTENGIGGSARPYQDPDGFTGKRSDFESGSGGTGGTAYIAPPTNAPAQAPVAVATAPIALPTMRAGDDGSRPAAFDTPAPTSMLNANRAESKGGYIGAERAPGEYLINGVRVDQDGAQILPTNNTTATAPGIDWKKYLPVAIVVLILIGIAFALRSKRSS
jgi:hypothetical protein